MTKSIFTVSRMLWTQHGEASRNWLALGLLLAAWNAVDGEEVVGARACPDELRGYSRVTVRAVHRVDVRRSSEKS